MYKSFVWSTGVLKFDIRKGSYLSALPYVLLIIVTQITGFLEFWIKQKQIMTTTQVCKNTNYYNIL